MTTAIIVLAAGASSRFGAANKLLADLDGEPVIRHTARAAVASGAGAVLVVTGADHAAIARALDGPPVELSHCAEHAEGMGTTIAHGVGCLRDSIDGAMILPGDMPLIAPKFLAGLIGALASHGGQKIIVTTTQAGEQRNPVIWPRTHFPELRALSGHRGAKALLAAYGDQVVTVPVPDEDQLLDIDTPDDLARAAAIVAAR